MAQVTKESLQQRAEAIRQNSILKLARIKELDDGICSAQLEARQLQKELDENNGAMKALNGLILEAASAEPILHT